LYLLGLSFQLFSTPLQLRQTLLSKDGNPVTATRKSLDAQHQGFLF